MWVTVEMAFCSNECYDVEVEEDKKREQERPEVAVDDDRPSTITLESDNDDISSLLVHWISSICSPGSGRTLSNHTDILIVVRIKSDC